MKIYFIAETGANRLMVTDGKTAKVYFRSENVDMETDQFYGPKDAAQSFVDFFRLLPTAPAYKDFPARQVIPYEAVRDEIRECGTLVAAYA